MLKRIKYINKDGQPYDMVLDLIRKKSKDIVVRRIDDNFEFTIPRKAVESITDPEKTKYENQ